MPLSDLLFAPVGIDELEVGLRICQGGCGFHRKKLLVVVTG